MRADDDQRLTLAREYLAGIRQTGVEQLPPSRLMTECAELRRQLGIVLSVVEHQGVTLNAAQLGLMLAALDDAERLLDDSDQADAYRALAREIGDQS